MNTPSPCRVLLVEDDPGDAHLARQALRSASDMQFDTALATNPGEARQHLVDSPPRSCCWICRRHDARLAP